MRIMDGQSKKGNYLNETKQAALENPAEELKNQNIKRGGINANEEDLRKYEEQVFIANIVSGSNFRNKKDFSLDFKNLRNKS